MKKDKNDLDYKVTGLVYGIDGCVKLFVDEKMSFNDLLFSLDISDELYTYNFDKKEISHINMEHYKLIKLLKNYWHDGYYPVENCFNCPFHFGDGDIDNMMEWCRIHETVRTTYRKIPEKCPFKQLGKCEKRIKELEHE